MYNIREHSINPFGCECDLYSGCPLENGAKNYCQYCYLFCKFNVDVHENNFTVKNLVETNIKLIETFTNYNIDISNSDYVSTFLKKNTHFMKVYFQKIQ